MDGTQASGHWADVAAANVLASGRRPVVSTGISPSGEIHIGNLREVLTADAVVRALQDRGARPAFNYVCDNFDPLRRVYPFLDPAVYGPLVGRPLSEIPCPCGRHPSYAEHFLAPFLVSLDELHIAPEVERADAMYKSGRMTPFIIAALERRDAIARILEELTGKAKETDWSPFDPLCPGCGKIQRARVTGWSVADATVDYRCACGAAGRVPMAGGGKLTWRVDWPARWCALGVTVEPFGKDHATRGGSYDTGVRIVREVFGAEPPFPIPYEWIALCGQGDMSSSKGNVLSIGDALRLAPPDALRYLVLRERPQRAITFDPGLPLLKFMDEMEDEAASGRDTRALELSRAAGFPPSGVPFRHLVVVAQVADFQLERIMQILGRSGYPGAGSESVAARIPYIRRWLEAYAPDELRFHVPPDLPEAARGLSAAQRGFLTALADALLDGMDGEAIHKLVYDLAPTIAGARPAELFEAIYLALLGKRRGPRAGWFVALLGPSTCAARFRAAASAAPSEAGSA
jgi:lysyl-tRNA synthetase class 1